MNVSDSVGKSNILGFCQGLAIARTPKRKTRTDISIPSKAISNFLFVEEGEEGKRNEGREREREREKNDALFFWIG